MFPVPTEYSYPFVGLRKYCGPMSQCFISQTFQVLKESLTGDGSTSMIACVSPEEVDIRETVNTLRYADCVKRMEKPQSECEQDVCVSNDFSLIRAFFQSLFTY